jgi:cell division protein FtsB
MISHIKRVIARIVLCAQCLLFGYLCIYGVHGFKRLQLLEKENQKIVYDNSEKEKEIGRLRLAIKEMEDNPFIKEQIAREKLQMARKDDEVYYFVDAQENEPNKSVQS